jgi:hypothetical protein
MEAMNDFFHYSDRMIEMLEMSNPSSWRNLSFGYIAVAESLSQTIMPAHNSKDIPKLAALASITGFTCAHAIEFMLKALLIKHGGFIYSHDNSKLFLKLPAMQQQELRKEFSIRAASISNQSGITTHDLDFFLSNQANTNIDWRYLNSATFSLPLTRAFIEAADVVYRETVP